ncbi:putative uncharacterized protein ENSP00000383309 [Battus philenor]|uniref:putative uncharacterized protein ENSP00000383309 n=1 Tax=Battus philenor TaxID=42288 RepID=UPI0035CFC288
MDHSEIFKYHRCKANPANTPSASFNNSGATQGYHLCNEAKPQNNQKSEQTLPDMTCSIDVAEVPPPILLRNKADWDQACSAFDKNITLSQAVNRQKGIQITVPTIEDHQALTKWLKARRIHYHTCENPNCALCERVPANSRSNTGKARFRHRKGDKRGTRLEAPPTRVAAPHSPSTSAPTRSAISATTHVAAGPSATPLSPTSSKPLGAVAPTVSLAANTTSAPALSVGPSVSPVPVTTSESPVPVAVLTLQAPIEPVTSPLPVAPSSPFVTPYLPFVPISTAASPVVTFQLPLVNTPSPPHAHIARSLLHTHIASSPPRAHFATSPPRAPYAPSPPFAHMLPLSSRTHVVPSPSFVYHERSPPRARITPSPPLALVVPSPSRGHVGPSSPLAHMVPSPSRGHVGPSPSREHADPSSPLAHMVPSPSRDNVGPSSPLAHMVPSPPLAHSPSIEFDPLLELGIDPNLVPDPGPTAVPMATFEEYVSEINAFFNGVRELAFNMKRAGSQKELLLTCLNNIQFINTITELGVLRSLEDNN